MREAKGTTCDVKVLCNLCYQGGYRPPLDCISCHKIDASAPMMSMDCGTCHLKEQEVQPIVNCGYCHNKLGGDHRKGEHAKTECMTCHAYHSWKVTSRDTCLICHGDKKDHNAPTLCGECHKFTSG